MFRKLGMFDRSLGMFQPSRFTSTVVPFSPSQLFAAGEQGAWYDPSDFSTMFQDSAGTTPVTAIGQPVGLILDESKGLVLGSEVVTNGTFTNGTTGWVAYSGGLLTAEAGRLKLTSNPGDLTYGATQTITTVAGKWYRATCNVESSASIAFRFGNAVGTSTYGAIIKTPTGNESLSLTFLATATSVVITLQGLTPEQISYWDNVSVKDLAGNHAYQSTTTSRPILSREAGGQYYLAFDGTDDWLQTANIDFSATDNVSVFTGLRKLSDAAQDVVVELSATIASNNGTFLLSAPSTAAANYSFSSKGTSQVDNTVTTFTAPITNVVTGLAHISSPVNTIRVNGAATTLTTSQGSGNYGTYPLYIGRRGGTTLPFNGRIYSLIIRGALTSGTQLTNTEAWVNSKTGAY